MVGSVSFNRTTRLRKRRLFLSSSQNNSNRLHPALVDGKFCLSYIAIVHRYWFSSEGLIKASPWSSLLRLIVPGAWRELDRTYYWLVYQHEVLDTVGTLCLDITKP
jgi:hypothetical protein